MKDKKILLILLLIMALLMAGGCNRSPKTLDNHNNDAITITDYLGRQVELPEKVERIACLYAFTGHVTAMLGRGDDIVAINNGLSRDVLLNTVSPGIGNNPIPYTHGDINIEELLTTDPDLVFINSEVGGIPAQAEKLEKFNIPYVVIDFNSLEEQMTAIQTIGDAVGESQKARDYNQYFQDCIDRVQQVAAKIPQDKRVRVYHSVNEATRTDTSSSLAADWMEKVGLVNVSVNQELRFIDGKDYASLEQILLWDPEVILVNESGVGGYIMTNPQWAPLQAVKNNQVYQMPIGIARWGHPGGLETPLAILWTARTVYPEYFEDLNIEDEARYYYKEFFNYEVPDELLQRILAGEEMRIPKGS